MSKQVAYNPLALNIKTDEPTFVNELGVRWWRIDVGDPKYGIPFRVEGNNISTWVILKDDKVIYATGSLEQLCWRFDVLRMDAEMP